MFSSTSRIVCNVSENTLRQAFDKVMVEGAYDKLAGEIYEQLRANQSK